MKQLLKYQCATILFLCCLCGCVSTTVVTHPEQFAEINTLGQDYRALLTIHTDTAGKTVLADKVNLTKDSLSWSDPQSYQSQIALSANLQRVRFVKRGAGAGDGAAIGAVPGIVIITLVASGLFSYGRPKETEILMKYAGAVAGSCVVIGTIVGALTGHKNDYLFAEIPDQKIISLNAVYIELGTFLVFSHSSLSINYERAMLPHLSLRAGVATSWSEGYPNRFCMQGMVNYFIGDVGSKFEIGVGLSVADKPDVRLDVFSRISPAISIGYRYQPTDDGVMFRVGGAWTYAYGLPFQISLGYSF